jgi:hypothetical protein
MANRIGLRKNQSGSESEQRIAELEFEIEELSDALALGNSKPAGLSRVTSRRGSPPRRYRMARVVA